MSVVRAVRLLLVVLILSHVSSAIAQHQPSAEELAGHQASLRKLQTTLAELRSRPEAQTRSGSRYVADVAVFEKAAEWMLRHAEFYQPDYNEQLRKVLELGQQRGEELAAGAGGWGNPSWSNRVGQGIRGYFSRVDGSVQPYALTLPEGVNPLDARRWPLHVVLHGRANEMNEVNFIVRHEGKKRAADAGDWIQLDVYGRGSNAYRWAGETDIFEAIADVKSRFRIDEDRVTLHGFSMGGAGAWHLGMHYPHLWSSVGPGAGFVDFYQYQKKTEQLPEWQHACLGIYDAVDYALNAANVPVCTYGGEKDPQLLASTTMQEAARRFGVEIKVIVGPGMGHKFDEQSQKEFMAFHLEKSKQGRPAFGARKHIRFTTRSLRYNTCDWVRIEEVEQVYQPSTIEAQLNDEGVVEVTATNISAFRIAREVADEIQIEGIRLPCRSAADALLPDVYYQKSESGWEVLDYDSSRAFAGNPDLRKRSGLQGPIDDAFMESFVCVSGTSEPWSPEQQQWSAGIHQQFVRDFDFWMRGAVVSIDDHQVTDEQIQDSNLILFGDPGSNSVLRRVLPDLPIEWTQERIRIGAREWNAKEYGVSLIYPNPLNPRRYIVINSGHTMSDKDFKSSNAWLFPRLGDIAVRKLKVASGEESIEWAANFDASWQLP